MSVTLTGTGGLYTRLGTIAYTILALNAWRGKGTLVVNSITGNGTTTTVTTFLSHGFQSNDVVTVAGTNSSTLNATGWSIAVTGAKTFTFASAYNSTASASPLMIVTKTSGLSYYGFGPYIDNIAAQFNSLDQNLIAALYTNRDSYRGVHSSLTSYLQGLAQSILIQMVNEDSPLSSQTLTNALTVLISQMKTASASVTKPTISTSVSAGGSNTGTGVLAVSALQPNGLQSDYIITETISGTCTADAQSGGQTAGNEQWLFTSPAQTDPLNWDWPLGSGTSLALTSVDTLADNSSGNVLQNGSGKTFTNTNAPDNWPIATGTAGTTIFQGSAGNSLRGSSCFQFTGNGSELTSIQQPFNTTPSTSLGAGGTSYVLLPSTVYAIEIADKVSATPAAGVLEVAIVNSSGTIQQDANGANCSTTVALTGETTSYALHTAFVRTPAVLPNPVKVRVRLSTALDNTKSVYFQLAMTPASQFYPGGPWGALFAGGTNWILNDTYTSTISNNYSSQWALALDRLFGLKALGLAIPSSGSPTIADSLIQS